MDINFTSFLDRRIQHYYCGFWVKTESLTVSIFETELDSACGKLFWKGQKHRNKGAVMQKTWAVLTCADLTRHLPYQGHLCALTRDLGTQGN